MHDEWQKKSKQAKIRVYIIFSTNIKTTFALDDKFEIIIIKFKDLIFSLLMEGSSLIWFIFHVLFLRLVTISTLSMV
jgi:hypothetical protein